eukprot:CAMPEP_0117557824 /NCGR_PEP_ID=MMETSP0784-20121206/52522_1 /TAXON_ID=39447 /ORGANISM="" /LENGTH=43 /DNA_ID= /DNA_START= /DNA_END= /DNA_ORIENTATION=
MPMRWSWMPPPVNSDTTANAQGKYGARMVTLISCIRAVEFRRE